MKRKAKKKILRRAHAYWGAVFLCVAGLGGYLIWQQVKINSQSEASANAAIKLSIVGQCQDGVDNDGNGKIDYPSDPGCAFATDYSEGVKPASASQSQVSVNSSISSFIVETIKKIINTNNQAEQKVESENKTLASLSFEKKSDINGDGKINLVDFSVMAYWFKKTNPPANVDLNNDGKTNLIDLSIMAFYWKS